MMSDSCKLERRGSVSLLTLIGDGEHRISPPLVDSILACLASLPSPLPHSSALITTNQGKFFCNGLDLSFPSRSDVYLKTGLLLSAFLSLQMPTIAAVCGHASGGGFIFALAHDHILMRKDRGFLYMSEIDAGVLIPPGPLNLIRPKKGRRQGREEKRERAEKTEKKTGKEGQEETENKEEERVWTRIKVVEGEKKDQEEEEEEEEDVPESEDSENQDSDEEQLYSSPSSEYQKDYDGCSGSKETSQSSKENSMSTE